MNLYRKTINQLIKRNISISVVESCTGGQLSAAFIDAPGISKIFNLGLITYSNNSKNLLLKIPMSKIKKYGAVSKKISYLMTESLANISKSYLCISTTGVAGPTGGSKSKPVGLVYIGIKFNEKIFINKKIFTGNRKKIQKDTVNSCFKIIKDLI